MQQPVEVQVDEHEQIVERVAAIDVAKASGMVCLRVPHETIPDRRVTKVWAVAATTAALVELGDHLRCERVARVVLESTSDYWRPFCYLLEAAGLTTRRGSGTRWCPPSRCAGCGHVEIVASDPIRGASDRAQCRLLVTLVGDARPPVRHRSTAATDRRPPTGPSAGPLRRRIA
jgi:hypothetical protein